MANILKKLFGSKADRDLKKMTPIVNACKAEYEQIDKLSDDALREASAALRKMIADYIAPEEEQVARIKEQHTDVEIEVTRKEKLATEQDELIKTIDKTIEEILEKILPRAFAIMKSTARRFAENATIKVRATDFDRTLSASHDFVSVSGDYAI